MQEAAVKNTPAFRTSAYFLQAGSKNIFISELLKQNIKTD